MWVVRAESRVARKSLPCRKSCGTQTQEADASTMTRSPHVYREETPAALMLAAVMREAVEAVGREAPDDPAERVRQHVLDRWYRFEEFGVTGRADLAAIKVTLSDGPSEVDPELGLGPAKLTSVSVAGTPLEGRLR